MLLLKLSALCFVLPMLSARGIDFCFVSSVCVEADDNGSSVGLGVDDNAVCITEELLSASAVAVSCAAILWSVYLGRPLPQMRSDVLELRTM